jgi:hypothetical protein
METTRQNTTIGILTDVANNARRRTTQAVIHVLGGYTSEQVSKRVEEAYLDGGGNDDPPSGDLRSFGYRSSGMSKALRNPDGIDYNKVIELAWQQYNASLLGRRLMRMKRDHIVGDNVTVKVSDDKADKILQDFWKSQSMTVFCTEIGVQLPTLGEQILPVSVRESDGAVVEVGYIDPAMLEKVVTHPRNARVRKMVIINNGIGKKSALRIINPSRSFVRRVNGGKVKVSQKNEGKLTTWEQDELEDWETKAIQHLTGKDGYDGDVFYIPFNAFSNQPRGLGDMAVVSDWLDQADAVLFQLCEREGYANYFSFDVAIDTPDDEVIRARAKDLKTNPPHRS